MSMFSVLASQVIIDTIAPTAPTNLSANATNPDTSYITLQWTHSTDNVGVNGYQIWRSEEFATFSVIGNTNGNVYTDFSAQYNSTYSYKIKAYDAAGNFSEFSNIDTVSPQNQCFVEGTIITLYNGTSVPIEKLVNGQELLSAKLQGFTDTNIIKDLYNWSSNVLHIETLQSPIVFVKQAVTNRTICINKGLLEATEMHSQLIKRNNVWSFIPIHNIKVGDFVYGIEGDDIEVVSVEVNNKIQSIYPLTLTGHHTYFANGVLTHNAKVQQ
jgi:hypothetical protein